MVSHTICPDPSRDNRGFGALICGAARSRQHASLVPLGAVGAVASRGRGFSVPFLAHIVVVEERAFGTDDSAAVVTIGPEAALADQRTDTLLLEFDRIEHIYARHLDVELRSGIPIE